MRRQFTFKATRADKAQVMKTAAYLRNVENMDKSTALWEAWKALEHEKYDAWRTPLRRKPLQYDYTERLEIEACR